MVCGWVWSHKNGPYSWILIWSPAQAVSNFFFQLQIELCTLKLVFTSSSVKVVIQSTYLYSCSLLMYTVDSENSMVILLTTTWMCVLIKWILDSLWELEAESETLNQSQRVGRSIVIGLFFHFYTVLLPLNLVFARLLVTDQQCGAKLKCYFL